MAILEKDYEVALIRSRVLAVETDEVPDQILKTKERQREQRNRGSHLQVDAKIVLEQNAIDEGSQQLENCLGFITKDEELLRSFVHHLPFLQFDAQKRISENITLAEITSAIKELSPRESPGVPPGSV